MLIHLPSRRPDRADPFAAVVARRIAVALVPTLAFAASPTAIAQVPTDRVEGLRDNTPRWHALTGARVVIAPGRVLERGTVVVRDGIVVAAGPEVAVPAGARVWLLDGKTVYPGFIDLSSSLGVPAALLPSPRSPDRRGAATPPPPPPPRPPLGSRALASGNTRVHPEQAVALQLELKADEAKRIRDIGFTTVLATPADGVFRGTSALVNLGDAADPKALVVAPRAAQHVAHEIDRDRAPTYPSSLMGAIALVRQTLIDARWYRDAVAFAARGNDRAAAERPAPNASLEALAPVLERRQAVVYEAADEQAYGRIARIRDEFDLRVLLRGNGHEYRRAAELKAAALPVIVPLAFPAPPEVENPDAALDVPLQALQHWEQAPSNLALLTAAGVDFAVTAAGLANPAGEFWPRLRQAVRRGLPAAGALAGLTTQPARFIGEGARLGTLEPGRIANIVVASGDLFADDKAVVELTFVDGRPHTAPAFDRFDARGTWRVDAGAGPASFAVEGTAERPTWKQGNASCTLPTAGRQIVVRLPCRAGAATEAGAVAVAVAVASAASAGASFASSASASASSASASSAAASAASASAASAASGPPAAAPAPTPAPAEAPPAPPELVIVAEGRADVLTGTSQAADGALRPWRATRIAGFVDPTPPRPAEPLPPPLPDRYPAGAFGIAAPPRPELLLVRDATVWTSAAAGRLERADLLVRAGKVAAVGPGLAVPPGATVVEAAGKHLTPGIVDAHSHTALLEGTNEQTSSVTAEVRVGDALDATDVGLYRELAGGVTAANVLHGSANTIGGQNQVIKLRWGSNAEALKFDGARPGIKFALGENVKQSNWEENRTTRYPQTRMGVEQLLRDAFGAARAYADARAAWAGSPGSTPEPRRDLQLETLVDILAGRRVIHVHSYRQDEILMFARLTQELGLTVAAYQHVLEGYKVADVMARSGAGGSTFADWWGYKVEVEDAVPANAAIMAAAGVLTSLNSDSDELARRLNTEAAKAVKYGGMGEAEALQLVTLNAAKQLGVGERTGSLEVGKDADFVIWSANPLSTRARAEQTWIDGRRYFDLGTDAEMRRAAAAERARLVAKALPARMAAMGEGGDRGGAPPADGQPRSDDTSAASYGQLERWLHETSHQHGSYRHAGALHECTEGAR